LNGGSLAAKTVAGTTGVTATDAVSDVDD
jgi:hypothetical protein